MRNPAKLAVSLGLCLCSFAQITRPVVQPGTYVAPDAETRIDWWGVSTLGPTSWLTGAFSTGWSTVWNRPEEWGNGLSGYGKRLATRTANVAVSNGLEVGLGAVWGEDPRYQRKGEGSFGNRARHVLKMTFMARYRDGSTKFAYARLIGNAGGNVMQNAWMPPSAKGAGDITYSIGVGISARAGSIAFQEFWPDVRKKVLRK